MKHLIKYTLGIFWFLIVLTFQSFGQRIEFISVTPPEGGNFTFVTGITQDVNGFMWYATKKGLYSYDGKNVTSYKNNPLNPNSIMGNFLESVYADHDGTIWVGSLGKGLDHFDPESGIFSHFTHDPNDPESLSSDTVTVILRDKQGTLWVGTHGGLDQYDPNTNKFNHYRYSADDTTSISNNQVRSMYEDSEGTLWIGTGSPYADNGGGPDEGGLNRFNRETGNFTRYMHDPNNSNSLLNNKISAIFEDKQGDFWIGTAKLGLHKMNRNDGTFERLIYDPAYPEKLSSPPITIAAPDYEHITFINQDAAGSYWFGTVDAGLFYFNADIGKMVNYIRTAGSTEGFNDLGAWISYSSRDGILWIGSTQGNIYHIDPMHKEIPHTLISSANVNSFYEEPDGTFWMGTNQGIIRIKNGIEKRYLIDPNPANADANLVYSIRSDRQGNIWFGSTGGLNLWDRKNEKFIRYINEPNNSNSLSNNNVTWVYEDKEGNFWVGTFQGLNLMDRKTGRFTHYFKNPANTEPFGENLITDLLEDKDGRLWVGAWGTGGISSFDRENKTFKNYLMGTGIVSIYQDTDGVLWTGGNDGFYRYNADIDNFIRYTDSGSPSGLTETTSIVEDDRKNLWLGTSSGIVKINAQRNESTLFGKNSGIDNSLTLNSGFKRSNGEIYFGDAAGYFSFSPVELTRNLRAPEVSITSFRLSDQKVTPGEGSLLKESLSLVKEIQLKYNQNVFSFDISVIDYAKPEQNQMIYYLENYDISWLQASGRTVYYFNVPPGKYIFRVKGANSYGVWTEKKIDIIILPPWWGTWWAYGIYVLLFGAAIFGIDRFQRNRLLKAEREKNREKELIHAKEIEKAYTDLKTTQTQLIQSEKMASLGELTAGIAHEIQNPLNFVNNFSEVSAELVEEIREARSERRDARAKNQESRLESEKEELEDEILEDIKQNLEKINHHGKRADAIVKGMLEHSRASSGEKVLTDINALADEYLRLSYHGMRAKDKSFNADFETHFDLDLPKINVVPQDIGRVLLNVINNAFQAVGTGHALSLRPLVTVSTKNLGNAIEISVIDNGPGIPSSIKDKIFQPFFTTKPTGQGTGLGLSLSYDIIKAHGGELKVETIEGKGSTFTISLNSN
ncbi:two-component regulator propeller domain-containing protein [Aquiflexum sp.]|uniref:two-component regulator propeller domain-containing protein n=1 Tax=Aquiflexum sp. TaxID=1872584 RepID=UPI0035946421